MVVMSSKININLSKPTWFWGPRQSPASNWADEFRALAESFLLSLATKADLYIRSEFLLLYTHLNHLRCQSCQWSLYSDRATRRDGAQVPRWWSNIRPSRQLDQLGSYSCCILRVPRSAHHRHEPSLSQDCSKWVLCKGLKPFSQEVPYWFS